MRPRQLKLGSLPLPRGSLESEFSGLLSDMCKNSCGAGRAGDGRYHSGFALANGLRQQDSCRCLSTQRRQRCDLFLAIEPMAKNSGLPLWGEMANYLR